MNKIIINNETIEILAAATSASGISFTLSGMAIQDALDKFSGATALYITEDDTVCGIYKGLTFRSAAVDAEGNVTVAFTIKDEIQKRMDDLENKCAALEKQNAELKKAQEMQNEQNAEQDELLAELLFGAEEEAEEGIIEEQGEEINE